jgi:iron complex outermembrane receptor protein
MRKLAPLFCLLIITAQAPTGLAQGTSVTDFKKLSLEELMDINVTSVARKDEPLGQTAAAVTVITAEDIRRSGLTSIAEVLRLVPGMEVARFNAGSWAISSRGFASTASNKLLVLIDGRTVYSPLFSGVFWDVQDVVLDDIERIEVVRGPGATLWGTNAVNGVIRIITKSAHQTQNSVAIFTGGGADDLGTASFRTGGAAAPNTAFRVFTKYLYRDQMALDTGGDAKDSVRIGRTGFRMDSTQGSDEFTLQGDFYRGFEGLPLRQDAKVLGGDVLGRWSRTISNTSSLQVQMYYDRSLRRVPLQSDFRQRTFDVDVSHQFAVGRHNVTWGAGYRWSSDTTFQTPVLSFVPAERDYPMETAFVQDEVTVARNQLKLQVGSKFEHNDFTGFEVQPSIRASWAIHADRVVWAAVSRPVRTATRFDEDIRFGPTGFQFIGNPNFESEKLVSIELGYRARSGRRLSYDVATYYNIYDDVRSLEFQPARGGILIMNNMNARAYGGEVSATYDALEFLRFTGSYSYLGKHLSMEPQHVDVFNGTIEGNDPRHQFMFRTSANVKAVEWDSTLRFVSRLPAPVVPRYWELDERIAWNASPGVELSVVGRNLLHAQHAEFGPAPGREEVERNIYGRVALRF